MAISYSKKTWVNGGAPAISAANLQVIDNGIQAACDQLDAQGTLTSAGTTAANEVGAGTGASTGEKLARLAAPAITALTAKTTLADADLVEVADSADSNAGKKATMANLLTYMRAATTGTVTAGYFPKYATVGSSVGIAAQCVSFPATQVASSDANALDDYEEGDWTGALSPETGTITMNLVTGKYTKIGRQVTVTGNLSVTSVSTPAGTLTVTGLPFTAGNATGFRAAISLFASSLSSSFSNQLVGRVTMNTTTLSLTYVSSGSLASDTATFIQAGSTITLACTYFV